MNAKEMIIARRADAIRADEFVRDIEEIECTLANHGIDSESKVAKDVIKTFEYLWMSRKSEEMDFLAELYEAIKGEDE